MSRDQTNALGLLVRMKGAPAQALDFNTLRQKVPAALNPRDLGGMSQPERNRTIRLAERRERQTRPKGTPNSLERRRYEQHATLKPGRSQLITPPGTRVMAKGKEDATIRQRLALASVNEDRRTRGLAPLANSHVHTQQQRNRDLGLKAMNDQTHALNFVRRLQGKSAGFRPGHVEPDVRERHRQNQMSPGFYRQATTEGKLSGNIHPAHDNLHLKTRATLNARKQAQRTDYQGHPVMIENRDILPGDREGAANWRNGYVGAVERNRQQVVRRNYPNHTTGPNDRTW